MADAIDEDPAHAGSPPGVSAPVAARKHLPRLAPWRVQGVRIALLLLLVAAIPLLLSVPALRGALDSALILTQPLLNGHPWTGRVLFVAVSALSAMLAFFSSAVLVPAAVFAWGKPGTILLLWCGWLLGGMASYAMGRLVRRPLLSTRRFAAALDACVDAMPGRVTWPLVLLLQLALPSEVPGYVCGILRVRFLAFATALALAEIPYAVGTVLLGESIVNARPGWFVVVGLAVAGCLGTALWLLRRRLRSATPALRVAAPMVADPPRVRFAAGEPPFAD